MTLGGFRGLGAFRFQLGFKGKGKGRVNSDLAPPALQMRGKLGLGLRVSIL